jgi:hypothetical protein
VIENADEPVRPTASLPDAVLRGFVSLSCTDALASAARVPKLEDVVVFPACDHASAAGAPFL